MKLIEITNNTSQIVASGSPIVLGNISRRVGCFTDYSAPSTTITIRDCGYYEIEFKVNATATVASQQVQVTMFIDGVRQNETFTTHAAPAIGSVETLNTHKKIRIFACSDSTISFINTGTAETAYDNIILDIKRVA